MFGDKCELSRIEYRKNENGLYTVYCKGFFGRAFSDGRAIEETLILRDCEVQQIDGEKGVLFSHNGDYTPNHSFDLLDSISEAVILQTEERIDAEENKGGASYGDRS